MTKKWDGSGSTKAWSKTHEFSCMQQMIGLELFCQWGQTLSLCLFKLVNLFNKQREVILWQIDSEIKRDGARMAVFDSILKNFKGEIVLITTNHGPISSTISSIISNQVTSIENPTKRLYCKNRKEKIVLARLLKGIWIAYNVTNQLVKPYRMKNKTLFKALAW